MRRVLLALDQGGHASRACLVDQDGSIVCEAAVPISTTRDQHEHVEHDAEQILGSLQTAIEHVLATAGVQIVAAGLATQRSTVVCFERGSGTALSPAISWQDRRGAEWLRAFSASATQVTELTGLPLSAHYGVSKMRWCLDHLPAVQRACARGELLIAPLASFLQHRLTGGEALVDAANASRTLLWNCAQHDWSAPLLDLFGIPATVLPRSVGTRAEFGELQCTAQRIALRAVTGDQSAVPFAFGTADTHTLYINLGTGAFLQRPTPQRPARAAPLLASVLSVDGDEVLYSLEGTVNGAGSAVAEFIERQALPERACWQQLEALPPQLSLPVFVNGVGGLGSPYWRPQQPSYFIGSGTTAQRFAAVLESVVFLIASNADLMRERAGALTRVIVSGGLSQSDWLCRRLAAQLGVRVLRGAREATVLGVAALAAPAGWRARRPSGGECFEPDALPAAERTALSQRRSQFDTALAG